MSSGRRSYEDSIFGLSHARPESRSRDSRDFGRNQSNRFDSGGNSGDFRGYRDYREGPLRRDNNFRNNNDYRSDIDYRNNNDYRNDDFRNNIDNRDMYDNNLRNNNGYRNDDYRNDNLRNINGYRNDDYRNNSDYRNDDYRNNNGYRNDDYRINNDFRNNNDYRNDDFRNNIDNRDMYDNNLRNNNGYRNDDYRNDNLRNINDYRNDDYRNNSDYRNDDYRNNNDFRNDDFRNNNGDRDMYDNNFRNNNDRAYNDFRIINDHYSDNNEYLDQQGFNRNSNGCFREDIYNEHRRNSNKDSRDNYLKYEVENDFDFRNNGHHKANEQSFEQKKMLKNSRNSDNQAGYKTHDRDFHKKSDMKRNDSFEEKSKEKIGKDSSYRPLTISKELVQPINYIAPILPRYNEKRNNGTRFIYVESENVPISKSLIKMKMDDQGVLKRIAILSYNSLFAEYETNTMAEQMINKYQILKKSYTKFEKYNMKLMSEEEINPKIQERMNQEETIFPNEKCFVVHNIDFNEKVFMKLLFPIYQDSFKVNELKYDYNRKTRTLTTYHTKQSTISDLYAAFNEGKSGLHDTYVSENINTLKLKEEVLKILTKKLVDACINDCSKCLIPDTILFAIRKERINIIKTRNSHGDSDRLINFYQTTIPMTFYISPLVHDAIKLKDKVKSESRKRKQEMITKDAVGYQKKLIQRIKDEEDINMFKKIKQPKLERNSSRLTPIHKIDENEKRKYLRPYAKSRLIPFRESIEGYSFHKTQFPVHIRKNMRSFVGTKTGGLATGNHLYFDKSTIQGWGLFTLDAIKKGSLICEYTGELIRTAVADLREERYDKSGLQMYLFRVDKEYIIDATLCGGLARFLNHSCNPNCKSKDTVSIGNSKTISFFAIKDIKPHEEITFNYKMEHEEDETKWERCYCGSKHCSGYLNGPKNPNTNKFRNSDDDFY